MFRRKKPNAQKYDWSSLRCPSCGSANVLKLESKGEDHCGTCHTYLGTLSKIAENLKNVDSRLATKIENRCELSACPNSESWVTRNTISQGFKCQSCGYRFSETRRVL